jgi:hypothetical protein
MNRRPYPRWILWLWTTLWVPNWVCVFASRRLDWRRLQK